MKKSDWKTLAICAGGIAVLLAIFLCVQCYRLERYRQRLEYVGMELTTAQNRQREIGECLRRTGQILDESIDTVGRLREALGKIRENYETMERILYSDNDYLCGSIGSFDNEIIYLEE